MLHRLSLAPPHKRCNFGLNSTLQKHKQRGLTRGADEVQSTLVSTRPLFHGLVQQAVVPVSRSGHVEIKR